MRSLVIFLTGIFLICNSTAQGQYRDSTVTAEQAVQFISKNLYQSHKQFRSGTICMVTGYFLMTLGFMETIDQDDANNVDNSNSVGNYLVGAGSLLTIIGWGLSLDSHKEIGEAGMVRLTPEGLVIKIKEKKQSRKKRKKLNTE